MIYSNFKGVYFEKWPESEQTFQKFIAAKWAVLAPIFFDDINVHEYTFQMSPFEMIFSNFKGVYFEIQNGSWFRRILGKSKNRPNQNKHFKNSLRPNGRY